MFSVLAQTTINKLQFLSIEGQRKITEMCWHRSQKIILFYERTRTKVFCAGTNDNQQLTKL